MGVWGGGGQGDHFFFFFGGGGGGWKLEPCEHLSEMLHWKKGVLKFRVKSANF